MKGQSVRRAVSTERDRKPFSARLTEQVGRLTASETRTIEVVLADPSGAALMSVSEIAGKAQVHEATATRLAQKLGFGGYPAMREALQVEYITRSDGATRVARSLERISGGGYLADLIGSEIDALVAASQALPQEKLDQAADLLAGAGRVFIFARGNALVLAELAERRLRQAGIFVVGLDGDDRALGERFAGITDRDVLLAFAFRRRPSKIDVLFRHAAGRGAATLLIADLSGGAVSPKATLTLSAQRGRSGDEYQTLTVPMAILNAVILTIAGRHQSRTIEALDAVSELVSQLES